MRSLSRIFIFATFVLFLGGYSDRVSAENPGSTGMLTVHAQGLTSGDGILRFTLFDSKKNYLKKPVRAGEVEITDQQGTWVLNDLPYGTYAVMVHHDINSNSKMESHWYGKPKEPSGVSNDAPAKMGPPKFKDAKFQLESPTLTLTITVK